MGRRKTGDAGAIEARRALVARGMLARKSVRAIARELAKGMACGVCDSCVDGGTREGCVAPVMVADCSVATVARDALALRSEWAKVRLEATEQLVGEEVARLNALEAALWGKAVRGELEAVDRVVAIGRERVKLLRLAPSGAGGGLLPELPAGGAARVQVTVEYVEDWRAARGGASLPPVDANQLANT